MSNVDLTWAVRGIDSVLRYRQRIEEYTDDRDCVFRISLDRAGRDLTLADGVSIRADDPIVQIHYWNEHMPALPDNGPMTGWASVFRHRVQRSLALLAERIELEPRFAGTVGIMGAPTFPARPGPLALSRACQHIGFDVPPPPPDSRVHALLDTLLVSGLIWTFNPRGLQRHGWSRGRIQIWMSRQTLMTRYHSPHANRH